MCSKKKKEIIKLKKEDYQLIVELIEEDRPPDEIAKIYNTSKRRINGIKKRRGEIKNWSRSSKLKKSGQTSPNILIENNLIFPWAKDHLEKYGCLPKNSQFRKFIEEEGTKKNQKPSNLKYSNGYLDKMRGRLKKYLENADLQVERNLAPLDSSLSSNTPEREHTNESESSNYPINLGEQNEPPPFDDLIFKLFLEEYNLDYSQNNWEELLT